MHFVARPAMNEEIEITIVISLCTYGPLVLWIVCTVGRPPPLRHECVTKELCVIRAPQMMISFVSILSLETVYIIHTLHLPVYLHCPNTTSKASYNYGADLCVKKILA